MLFDKMTKVSLIFVSVLAITVLGCDPGWISFGKNCYAFVDRPEPWAAAIQYCQALGASLVRIDDQNELRFLQLILRAHYKANDITQPIIEFWTAGNDIIVDGSWVWAPDNEPMEFAPWGPGEPNDLRNGKDDCAALFNRADFNLNDDNCNESRFFICETRAKRSNCQTPRNW